MSRRSSGGKYPESAPKSGAGATLGDVTCSRREGLHTGDDMIPACKGVNWVAATCSVAFMALYESTASDRDPRRGLRPPRRHGDWRRDDRCRSRACGLGRSCGVTTGRSRSGRAPPFRTARSSTPARFSDHRRRPLCDRAPRAPRGLLLDEESLAGSSSVVLHWARIGRGATVGANAVVPNNVVVPPGALALGVPAKIFEGRSDRP